MQVYTLFYTLVLLLFTSMPLSAGTIVLCSDDGGRFPVLQEELILHPQATLKADLELIDIAKPNDSVQWRIFGVPGAVLGPLVHAMRQLHQIRHAFGHDPYKRKFDYCCRLVWPEVLDNVQALEVAYGLGMDDLIIVALAQRVAGQLSIRHMFFGDTRARLLALPEQLIEQVLLQHIVLYGHRPWRARGHNIEVSIEDVYEYSATHIIVENATVKEWAYGVGTYKGVLLTFRNRKLTSLKGLERIAGLYPNITLMDLYGCRLHEAPTFELFPALETVNLERCGVSRLEDDALTEQYARVKKPKVITSRRALEIAESERKMREVVEHYRIYDPS